MTSGSPALQLRFIKCERNNIEHNVFLGDRKVVQHAHIGHLDLRIPDDFVLGSDLENRNDVAAKTFGLIAKSHQVTGYRITLGMGRERLARQFSIKGVVRHNGIECQQIECGRRAVFLEREQQLAVVDNVRVGGAAAQASDARVILGGIAENRKQM